MFEKVQAYEDLLVLKGGSESVTIRLVTTRDDNRPLFVVNITRALYNQETHSFSHEKVGDPKWVGGVDERRMEEWFTRKFKEFRDIQAENEVDTPQAKTQKEDTEHGT